MKTPNTNVNQTGVKSKLAFAAVATGIFLVAAAGASAQACESHKGGASAHGAKKIPVYPLVLPVKPQPVGTIRDHRASAQPVAPRPRSRDVQVRDHRQPATP
jgi:hypothetical protein